MKNKKLKDIATFLFILTFGGIFGYILCTQLPIKNNFILDDTPEFKEREEIDIYTSALEGYVLEWTKPTGGAVSDMVKDLAGNVYLGGEKSVSGKKRDLWVGKYNQTGDQQWLATFGGSDDERSLYDCLSIDSQGNCYITGYTYSYGDSNGDVITGKINSTGSLEWTKIWGGSNADISFATGVDSQDNIYVGGYTKSFGAVNIDIFLIKYNSSGEQIWDNIWGTSGMDVCRALTLDSEGNIYVSGDYATAPGTGYSDYYTLKFNSSGDLQWKNTYSGGSMDMGNNIALDSNDNIYVVGTDVSSSATRVFARVLKYDKFGNFQWTRRWGQALGDPDVFRAIAIDSSDNIYAAGYTGNFGAYDYDGLLVKYDSMGNQLWYELFGSAGDQITNAIIVNDYYDVYLSGPGLTKLNSEPKINLYMPDQFYCYEDRVPSFNLSIVDQDLNFTWYTTNYSNTKYFFEESYGKINQTEWDLCEIGPILITFYANDSLSQMSSQDVIVVKVEVPEPYFTNETHFLTFLKGEIPEPLIWSPTIDYTAFDSYWIYQNNTLIEKGKWYGNQIIYSNLSILEIGDYNFTCFVNNTVGEISQSSIIVSVKMNNAPSIFNNIENFVHTIGTADYILSWKVIDIDGNNQSFWIERNGQLVLNGYWNDHSNIEYIELNTSLPSGIYNYTCFVTDTLGLLNYSSIFVSLTNHAPQIINNIENFQVNYGDSGFILSWYAFDVDGNNHSFWIERNGVTIDKGYWNNDNDIIFMETDDSLLNGVYDYICYINDTFGGINASIITITVINHNPFLTNNIDDFEVNYGNTGFTLSWYAFDLDGNNHSYWIERNGIRIYEGNWNNYANISFIEINLLDPNNYIYTCFINDSLNLINQSSIRIIINSWPYSNGIRLPYNNIYDLNANYIFNCSWFDIDGTIEKVKFEFGSYNYSVSSNYSGEFSIILKNLAANENGYQFRWHAMDNDGVWNSTDWQVFVLHKQNVQLLILFNGTQDNLFDSFNPVVNITAYNLNSTSGNLQLFVDSQLIQQVENYFLTSIAQYLNGAYNITVILTDQNYTGYAMQWLIIQDTSLPVILFNFSEDYLNTTAPEYYHKGLRITCTVLDSSPLNWVYLCENSSGIFLNRSMINLGNGDWVYDVEISHLNWKDCFCFSFFANDSWGNVGNTTILYRIEILDYQNPNSRISYIPQDNPNIINSSTSFTINANDIGSGIFVIRYKINDSNWIQYVQPFNLSTFNSGTYKISYYSVDNAGNVEVYKSIIVILVNTEEPAVLIAIPGFNLSLLILTISISSILVLLKQKISKIKNSSLKHDQGY